MTRETALEAVEQYLARGDWRNALDTLLPALETGDRAALLAARLLRAQDAAPIGPDAMALALDRLATLVERQEAQIRALLAMVEEKL